MKKRTIISIAVATMISCPAFATGSGIGASAQTADCDNGVLGTYTGPAALSANWTANTINLDFYDGEDKISSGQCTYDGGIELPNDPEKTGYEFSGWKVRRAPATPTVFDLTTLAEYVSIPADEAYSILRDSDTGNTLCKNKSGKNLDCNDSRFNDLSLGETKMKFSYGTVKAVGICSKFGSGYSTLQTGNPTDDWMQSGAGYCWCSVTGFDPENDGTYLPVTPSIFVYRANYYIDKDCAQSCPRTCGNSNENFRRALYGITQ